MEVHNLTARKCSRRVKLSHFLHPKARNLGYTITEEEKNGKWMCLLSTGISWKTGKGYCTSHFWKRSLKIEKH